MTRHTFPLVLCALAALVLSTALPARADGYEVSLGIEPEGAFSEYSGLDVDAGLFVGFAAAVADDWSVELRWLSQDRAFLSFDSVDLDTWQLGARRHFVGSGDWKPFVHGGLHYGRLNERRGRVCVRGIVGPCPPERRTSDDLGVYAGGGVDWQFLPSWAVRFDGRLVVYASERTGDLEDDVDLTAGVVFRF